jgi:hypothetical protein
VQVKGKNTRGDEIVMFANEHVSTDNTEEVAEMVASSVGPIIRRNARSVPTGSAGRCMGSKAANSSNWRAMQRNCSFDEQYSISMQPKWA